MHESIPASTLSIPNTSIIVRVIIMPSVFGLYRALYLTTSVSPEASKEERRMEKTIYTFIKCAYSLRITEISVI